MSYTWYRHLQKGLPWLKDELHISYWSFWYTEEWKMITKVLVSWMYNFRIFDRIFKKLFNIYVLLSRLRLNFFHHVSAPTRAGQGHNDDVFRKLLVIFEQSSLLCEALQRSRKIAPEHVLAIELHGKYEGIFFNIQ